MTDIKELKKLKHYKNLKSAENFIKKEKNFYYDWEYGIISIKYDFIEEDKNFTGIYDKLHKIVLENEVGNHVNSTMYLAWVYLIIDYFNEEQKEKYKEQIEDFMDAINNYKENRGEKEITQDTILKNEGIVTPYHVPKVPVELFPVIDNFIERYLVFKERDTKKPYTRKEGYKFYM